MPNKQITVYLSEDKYYQLASYAARRSPMGKILSKTKMKGKCTIYANKDACRQCPNKCTSSKVHKMVSFGPETTCVPAHIYGTVKQKLNPIPHNEQISSYNHTFDRSDYYAARKVILRIKRISPSKKNECVCLSILSEL